MDVEIVRALGAWERGENALTLKRQMYGRAKLDLLGRRFLLAA
jgi:hypothetical protein